ncbi:uncharacterized protein KY384_006611 [Bacidia gigantensis]|uniref:uncharacterized protein n=1 Tax=Bacidia gigantensis TaxID=2732470 RepID=UPI001D054925|nr:uncharacterized protein KY384_006611 [Bacidia gigantensis]KAG8528922.1 hypothetical protein KY384_006611 [Bacidia gigantensis]
MFQKIVFGLAQASARSKGQALRYNQPDRSEEEKKEHSKSLRRQRSKHHLHSATHSFASIDDISKEFDIDGSHDHSLNATAGCHFEETFEDIKIFLDEGIQDTPIAIHRGDSEPNIDSYVHVNNSMDLDSDLYADEMTAQPRGLHQLTAEDATLQRVLIALNLSIESRPWGYIYSYLFFRGRPCDEFAMIGAGSDMPPNIRELTAQFRSTVKANPRISSSPAELANFDWQLRSLWATARDLYYGESSSNYVPTHIPHVDSGFSKLAEYIAQLQYGSPTLYSHCNYCVKSLFPPNVSWEEGLVELQDPYGINSGHTGSRFTFSKWLRDMSTNGSIMSEGTG